MAFRTVLFAASALSLIPSTLAVYEHDREVYLTQEYSWYKRYAAQPDQYCVYGGCYVGGSSITFNSPDVGGPEDYYVKYCTNKLLITSLWQCAQLYCSIEEAEAMYHLLNDPCELHAGTSLPRPRDSVISSEELAKIPVLNSTEALATYTDPLNSTAIPDREMWESGYRTIHAFYKNWHTSSIFAFSMVGFWGFVLLVGMIYRVTELIKRPTPKKQAGWWLWTRRNLILPATFSKHQSEAVGHTLTIPPRLETIILTLFVIMNLVMCFPAYELMSEGNVYYATKNFQLARYIGDRTGYLSIALLPMVWLFAARNNLFMWLTGWSFATFNRFHRWVARISVIHAIIHSAAWTMYEVIYAQSLGVGKWTYYNQAYDEEYWWMGVIATVLMSVMLGASVYILREKSYDLFLILHIVLSIVFFVTLWYHVRIFNGEFNYWLYFCIAVWVLDRLLRLGRTAIVSLIPRFTKGTRAIATYDRKTEMVRLDITDFLANKPIIPGHFYYLYMPNGLRGYESHPFTLCSWYRPETNPVAEAYANASSKKEVDSRTDGSSESYTPGEVVHTLLVRPYKGMTGRLHQKLVKSHESVASTQETVFLEGPYGVELDLSHYSDVLVICGGSGITAAISHSNYLLHKNSTTRVHIAWAVPQRHLPDDICAHELSSVIRSDRVHMRVYLTDKAEQEYDSDSSPLPDRALYEIRQGRPDIEGVMREFRAQAQGNLAIVTCGTPQMADVCRKATVKILGEPGVNVGYYNETMLW